MVVVEPVVRHERRGVVSQVDVVLQMFGFGVPGQAAWGRRKVGGVAPHGICGVEGSLLHEVGKPDVGLGTCRMYLCSNHVAAMKSRGFTVVPVHK